MNSIKVNNNKKIRFYLVWSLVFSFIFHACGSDKKPDDQLVLQWENEKAVALFINGGNLVNIPADSIEQVVRVQLTNTGQSTAILGKYTLTGKTIVFRPLIPFTRGLTYQVWIRNEMVDTIEVPAGSSVAPELTAVYPSIDTIPENLLKVYLEFSKPMQEGQSPEYLVWLKAGNDTLPDVFLDLQPELWNKERTVITLWLDPGRIKRDLQPNKTMGPPLLQGQQYQLVIREGWRDASGISLSHEYRKNFIAGPRDETSPDPNQWSLSSPRAGTLDTLVVETHEPLDYMLLSNSVNIIDGKGAVVQGQIHAAKEGTRFLFIPAAAWAGDEYILETASRLEDLAGNNLNRLFDTDLTKKQKAPKEVFPRSFRIR